MAITDLDLNNEADWVLGVLLTVVFYYGQAIFYTIDEKHQQWYTAICDTDDDATAFTMPNARTGFIQRIGMHVSNMFFGVFSELAHMRPLPIFAHETLGFIGNALAIIAAWQFLAYAEQTDEADVRPTDAAYDFVWFFVVAQAFARIVRNYFMYVATLSVSSGTLAMAFQLIWSGCAFYAGSRIHLHYNDHSYINTWQWCYAALSVVEGVSVLWYLKCHTAFLKSAEYEKILDEADAAEKEARARSLKFKTIRRTARGDQVVPTTGGGATKRKTGKNYTVNA